MDAPPAGVTAVKIWVAAMQVHVDTKEKAMSADPNDASIDDDGKWHSLTVNRSIDLVQHQGETAADVLGQLELPEGKVTQVRLVIDTAKPNVATRGGVDCDLDTSRVAEKGIKLNHVFKAFSTKLGAKQEILVDFDLGTSMIESGACYVLAPKLELRKVKTDGKIESL